jgi:hypothetical protein
MNIEEKCFAELDWLYPAFRLTTKRSTAEFDEHLAAVLHALYRDEVECENERREKEGLGWKTTLDIIGEWHVARGLVKDRTQDN